MSKSCSDVAKEIKVLEQMHGEIDRLELERQRIQYLADCSVEGSQTRLYLGMAITSVISAQRNIQQAIQLNTTNGVKEANANQQRNGERPADGTDAAEVGAA